MRLDAAIFGEVNKGHALRAATGDLEFARSIAGRMDVPSTPPSGVDWSPAISGFPFLDRYVVSRTFADLSAPRGNMVVAHALVMPLAEIQDFSALDVVIGHLAADAMTMPEPAPIEAHDAGPVAGGPDVSMLAALLPARGNRPVIHLGSEGFEQVVARLWRNLWPAMRRSFAFRLSFGPEDLVETPTPTLIYTPRALAGRWADHLVIGQSTTKPTLAASILAGISDPEPLLRFAERIGARDLGISSLTLLERAFDMLGDESSLDDIVGAVRLIDRLSGSMKDGTEFKSDLLRRLAALLRNASVRQLMSLRNLALAGFSDDRPIWLATTDRVFSMLIDGTAATQEFTTVLAASADQEQAVESWRVAVRAAVRSAALKDAAAVASAFWTWLRYDPNLAEVALGILPTEGAVEHALSKALPSRDKEALSALLGISAVHRWRLLKGQLLAATMSPEEAVREVLHSAEDAKHDPGLAAALNQASPEQKVTIALEVRDPRLIEIASAEVALRPELLAEVDLTKPAAQQLWAAAMEQDIRTWNAVQEPRSMRDTVLTNLLDGAPVELALVRALARTPLADLSDFARRNEIWGERDEGGRFLLATAESVVSRAAARGGARPDPVLEEAVLRSPALSRILGGGEPDLGRVLGTLEALSWLPEERVAAWLTTTLSNSAHFDVGSSERLGRLIRDRRWLKVLDVVKSGLSRSPALRPILSTCATLLPAQERWRLGVGHVSIDEKWTSFGHLAANLYPAGPDERDIWERSGGRNSHIARAGNGQTAWRDALRQVRNGGGVGGRDLIERMLEDYPNNPELKAISRDHDICPEPRNGFLWWLLP